MNNAQLGYNFIDHGNGAYTVLTPAGKQYEINLDPSGRSRRRRRRGHTTPHSRVRYRVGASRRARASGAAVRHVERHG
jgi:hypothetical protein